MNDRVQFDPPEVERARRQHYERRDWLAEQAKQKEEWEWHAMFEDNFGKIAGPVKAALGRYLDKRGQALEALSEQHGYMGDALGAFLDDMKHTDDKGAHDISNIFGGSTFGPGSGLSGPSGPGRSGPSATGPVGSGAPGPAAAHPAAANGSNGAELAGAPTAGLAGAPAAPLAGQAANDGQPRPQGESQHGETVPAAGAQNPAGGGPSGGGPGPSVVVPPVASPGTTPPVAATPDGQVPGEPVAGVPMFPGAAQAARQNAAEPPHVVDPGVNEDLVLARTLLAAVLAAIAAGGGRQSTIGVDWSVSVMRGPGGASVFVTTNEGRGWLPAGLFLPQEVTVPWLSEVADGAHAWEEIADPARVLVEFAHSWGERSGARLTALVSSTDIDHTLRALVGESVGIEANIGPASSDLDLAAPGPGLVDRLTAVGGDTGDVPESQVTAQCMRLAADAHAQVVRTVGAGLERVVREVAVARGLREQILTAVQAGREVPEQLWQELWNADVVIEAALAGRRSQAGNVYLGDARLDRESIARQLLFERRCNELALLLANGASRQTLRDISYSHGQVLGHPLFGLASVAEVGVGRPTVTVSSGQAAGRSGVAAPSVDSPPSATPWASGGE